MSNPNPNLTSLHSFIRRLQGAYRRGAARLTIVRLLWVALAAVGVLLALDAMFPMPPLARQTLAWMAMATLLVVAAVTWRQAARAHSLDRHVVRQIERGYTGLQNDLINALEFSTRLESIPPAPTPITATVPSTTSSVGQPTGSVGQPTGSVGEQTGSVGLMGRAIDRALDEITLIRDWSPLRPPNLRRERNLLLATLALIGISLLVFNEVYSAVLPRYLDPHGDHPPYSPTHITVSPAGAHVNYGDQLAVTAKTTGVLAREAHLVLQDEAGRELQKLPMFETDKGQFAQTIENIRQPLSYHIAVPGGRSRRFALTLNKTPRIESVLLRLTPPDYVHQPQQERQLATPLIKGYAKSRVHLIFSSNRPLASGTLRLGSISVPLAPDGPNAVGGQFELTEALKLTASVTDVEGLIASQEWKGEIQILPDEKPTVTITSPGMDSFAIPSAKVPIVIEANDDLGFRNMTLLRCVNGSRDFRKVLLESDGTESFLHAVETLDLFDLGAQPGDVISYYATATDSYPAAPQTATTPAYQLAIISFNEYKAYLQTQMTAEDLAKKYAEYQNRLEQLASEQEALAKETAALKEKAARGETLSAAEQEALTDAQARQQDLARQAEELADDLRREAANPPIFDIEKDFKEKLGEFAEQLDAAAGRMQSAGEAMERAGKYKDAAAASQALEQSGAEQQAALEALGRSAENYKEGIGDASRELDLAMDLIGDVEQFKYLYQRQKELERQAGYFKSMTNPGFDDRVRMKELNEEQADIRQQLEQLVPQLRRHADAIEPDLPEVAGDAREIAKEIESRAIPTTMKQAEDRLGQADGPGGHPPAQEALSQMEAMIQFCNGAGGEGGQCDMRLQIKMSNRGMSMGNTMEQLRAGLNPGVGRMGTTGSGADGYLGSANQFGFYGSEKFGSPTQESKIAGAPAHAQSVAAADALASVSSIEEIDSASDDSRQVTVKGDERVMEEYRTLIEAYFRTLAEEK